jgi:uncharacterized protein YbjT (DUF2867 family)
MQVLVTGATGFIANQLIPHLLAERHRVRAMARNPARLACKSWACATEVVGGDVLDPPTLRAALEGVNVAYYLIHSLCGGDGYASRDIEGARNFAQAAACAGVQHIIYVGGLADPAQRIGPYMRSRVETGAVLRSGPVPVTEFRASVIAGWGGASFEMIRRIVELFPLIPGPTWMRHRTQPIAAEDVVHYLIGALHNEAAHGKVFEVGGPDVMRYDELMLHYARLRGLRRRIVLVPGLPVWLMALGFRLLTPVPQSTAAALVGELRMDSIVTNNEALHYFPEVKLNSFASVVRATSGPLKPPFINRVRDLAQRALRDLEAVAGAVLGGQSRVGAVRMPNSND